MSFKKKVYKKRSLRLRNTDLLDLYYCLEQFIRAGIPMRDLLYSLRSFPGPSDLGVLLRDIEICFLQGGRVSEAFALHPKIFDPVTVGLIALTEKTGDMAVIFGLLRTQLSKSLETNRRFYQALLYPMCVFFFLIGVGGFLSFSLLPSLVHLLEELHQELPYPTQIFMAISTFLVEKSLFFLGFFLSLGGLGAWIFRFYKPWKRNWDYGMYQLPGWGRLRWTADQCRLLQVLHLLLKSRIPLQEAFVFLPRLFKNTYFQESLEKVFRLLQEGKPLSAAWAQTPLASPLIERLIRVGEETGTLESSFSYLGTIYEQRLQAQGNFLLTLLQPCLLFCLGGLMSFILWATLSPFYGTLGEIL